MPMQLKNWSVTLIDIDIEVTLISYIAFLQVIRITNI